jgi:hypothetical protein
MKVLIACEFSGVVRRSFRMRGHDAWSADLIPSEDNSEHHIVCQSETHIFDLIDSLGFDLMIAHPPCRYLCNSGVRWLFGGKGTSRDPDRWKQMELAAEFFKRLWLTRVPKIAVENPIMHRYAKEIIKDDYSQTIQPWQHGCGETKTTCLWLRNLPELRPSNIVEGRRPRIHFESPSPNRWKERSRTYVGIAEAMASQWGSQIPAA